MRLRFWASVGEKGEVEEDGSFCLLEFAWVLIEYDEQEVRETRSALWAELDARWIVVDMMVGY